MLKSLFKIHRIVLPKTPRAWSLHGPSPQYSIFNIFKKKKEEDNLPQQAKKDEEVSMEELADKLKKEQEQQDDFIDKKQYFEKLKKEREEFESEKEKAKRQFEFEEQQDRRDYQVNISQIDYARILQENINIRVTETFTHLEELYYFISDLRVRLSEENIRKCLEGFLSLAERINEKDLEKPQFYEFINILKTNVTVIANNETLLLALRFADLYIVDDPDLWVLMERKVLQKAAQLSQEELISCVIHFSNQNEGSDQFYDQLEKTIIPQAKDLGISQLVALAQSYYQVKKGSGELFNYLHSGIMEKMGDATPADLIRLSLVYSAMNIQDKTEPFNLIEKHITEKIDQFNIPEICLIAESFGLDNGSEEFFGLLEKKIIEKLPEMEFEQIMLVLKGFFYTYRGSKVLFEVMKSRFEMFFPRMELKDLALIAKAYHVTENDDKQFESLLEKYVVNNLKKLEQLTVGDLYEVATSYNMTRTGSRELYKILEFVIREKMAEIAKEPEVARGMYYMYTTSGLCSPDLIKKLQFIV